MRELERGRAHFAIIESHVAVQMLGGLDRLAAIGLLWPNYLHVIGRKSGATDLRIPLTQKLLITESALYVFEALSELSLDKKGQWELVELAKPGVQPLERAGDGDVTVLFSAPAPLEGVLKMLTERDDLQLLRVSNNLAEEMKLRFPWLQTEILPRNSYPGINRNWVLPVWHHLMVGRRNLSVETVEKMLKTIYGNNRAVRASNPLFRSLNGKLNETFAKLIPFHPVTARTFKFVP